MRVSILRVIAVTILATVAVAAHPPETLLDRDAYAVYEVVLPHVWTGEIPLRRETSIRMLSCHERMRSRLDAEWQVVLDDFIRQNVYERLLHPAMLRTNPGFPLISAAEIDAHEKALELKYPGLWQRRPGSLNVAYVSAVGFNPERTKAFVHAARSQSGRVYPLVRQDGKWMDAKGVGRCSWII